MDKIKSIEKNKICIVHYYTVFNNISHKIIVCTIMCEVVKFEHMSDKIIKKKQVEYFEHWNMNIV